MCDYRYVKGQKSYCLNTKPCNKPYKFELEVKGQRHIGIMNVRNVLSYGDTPMCQIR